MLDMEFYRGKKVLITGHTGFKGAWLSKILINSGAEVTGYSLKPPATNLFDLCKIEGNMNSYIGDIRNIDKLKELFQTVRPEIVFHLAAQPIVRDSYKDPIYTYETNVMGTVNILECVRQNISVKSFLNVTTDKVYHNNEWEWGYRETDPLDGYDPYSNSKSCSELVTHSYKDAFFKEREVAISTARAVNVIGGGDFAKKEVITVRNPKSIRPYQHVLEPLIVYLTIVQKQYEDMTFAGYYNVGPDDNDCITTGELVELFCNKWGDGQSWINKFIGGPHEANFLKLDCSKVKKTFNWRPCWNIETAVEKVIDWTKIYIAQGNIEECMDLQINEFLKLGESRCLKK